MVDKYLLRIVSFALNENINILGEFFIKWKLDISNYTVSKEFYTEIQDELDRSTLIIKYQALGKILVSFIQDVNFSFLSDENIEDNFIKVHVNEAFEYGILNDLIRNLYYFHMKLTTDYQPNEFTINKCTLMLFMKLNIYLIFIMLYFLRLKKDMITFIKQSGDELEEITLELIKLCSTHMYFPSRLLLSLYYIYFTILVTEDNVDDNEIHTCRKVEPQMKYLTKQNYKKYFKQKIPLIFNTIGKSNNYIEKFYRKNMLKKDKPDAKKVIIYYMLKILLATYDKKSANSTVQKPSPEYIKDYITDMILRKNYLDKIPIPFQDKDVNQESIDDKVDRIEEEKEEGKENDLEEDRNIDIDLFFKSFEESSFEEKGYYCVIELLNKLSIRAIIVSLYTAIIKQLQSVNLIQSSYFLFQLSDSRGVYVFLIIINMENKIIEEEFINDLKEEYFTILYNELTDIIIQNSLWLIYKISFKNDESIQELLERNIQIMLKNLLANYDKNEKIKRYCLKLSQNQMKFYDRTWRMNNANIITSIYLTLNVSCGRSDNYLERKDKNAKEINMEFFNKEEAIKLYQEFHEYNYLFYLNNPNEYEKYSYNLSCSRYARIYMKLNRIVDNEELHGNDSNMKVEPIIEANNNIPNHLNKGSSSPSPRSKPKSK